MALACGHARRERLMVSASSQEKSTGLGASELKQGQRGFRSGELNGRYEICGAAGRREKGWADLD